MSALTAVGVSRTFQGSQAGTDCDKEVMSRESEGKTHLGKTLKVWVLGCGSINLDHIPVIACSACLPFCVVFVLVLLLYAEWTRIL